MAVIRASNEEQSRLQRFAELSWLDAVISFVFRLIAKLAEPFLAVGLVASAIDYGTHGAFLGAHRAILGSWVVTQALALEGSGGVALAMSFDAQADGDHAKAWSQRVLAVALFLVGGIMFFMEMSASIKGFNEATMPDWYIYGMAALRSIVSLGYIAVMRTREHRFSGEAPPAQPAPQIIEDLLAQTRAEMAVLRTEVMGASATTVTEVRTEMTRSTHQANSEMRTVSTSQSEQSEVGPRIQRYILQIQEEEQRMPIITEIMDACNCAKNTTVRHRRKLAQKGEEAYAAK